MSNRLQEEFWPPKLDFSSEGVKYAGSKAKLIQYILPEVFKLDVKRVLDGFAGTTRVSQALARNGFSVTLNDAAEFSKVFGECYLLADPRNRLLDKKIQHLNSLVGSSGWFTEHYGGDPSQSSEKGGRYPWQRHNTEKLDAIRPEIDKISDNEIEKSVLLTSLILALDTVDNTLGHYAAYLSGWSKRSYNSMILKKPKIVQRADNQSHRIFCGDINKVLRDSEFDLCYFDPPYGSNNEKMPPSRVRYSAYYHLWKTVVLNDRPLVFGRVNRREDSRDTKAYSVFEDFRRGESGAFKCVEAIQALIAEANTRYVMLSYSSGGRATLDGLLDVLTANGKLLSTLAVDHARHVMSSMTWTNKWTRDKVGPHQEFIFVVEKR